MALGVFVLIVANEVFLTILLSLVFALGLDPLVGWFTARELMASRRERMEALRASRASPT